MTPNPVQDVGRAYPLASQGMTPFSQFFNRRSITFALLALLVGIIAASHGLGFSVRMHPPSGAFAVRFVVLCVVAFAVCIRATINLVRDVERGYPPGRCSLAAVILLFAFAVSALSAVALAGFILDQL